LLPLSHFLPSPRESDLDEPVCSSSSGISLTGTKLFWNIYNIKRM
jgi:hypothetical protein